MPYAVTFSKKVDIQDPDQYINDCCIGGDVVLDRLLPALKRKYGDDLQANQEDWGWFAWFDHGPVKLAVDIFTDDHKNLEFQILLTSRRPRFILKDRVEDGSELESLKELVVSELSAWSVSGLVVQHVNEKYLPA
jgi:hypothetical protein